MTTVGKIYLVGAGPGHPKLLTLRAAEVLALAEVVYYDRLVNPAILERAPQAELLYSGKEPVMDSQERQDRIIKEMIRLAKLGKTVIRLKGGDPFVFGRGGEEVLALSAAGIPVEVVPGISSAISVPASVGIPVTHRGLSAAFAVFAGQTEHGGLSDDLWRAAALIPTAVFLMGVERLPVIVEKQIEHGRDIDTPIALISKGTLPDSKIVVGTLNDIVAKSVGVLAPSIIVIGVCVSIREQIEVLRDANLTETAEAIAV